MSHVTEAVARSAELGWVLGVTTAVFLAAFATWTFWAWSPANQARWDAAARMPLDDEEPKR